MISFSRFTTILLFVLSLSFLTCAASTSSKTRELSARGGGCDALVTALANLDTKLKVHLDSCIKADVLADVQEKLVIPLVADIDATVHAAVEVGSLADLDVKVKADIAARIATIVTLVAKILIKLSTKLSVSVMTNICARIDVCLKALLVALNVCISGIVGLSLKAIVDLTVLVFIKVKLSLCADVLGLLKIGISL
ncbi:hypothetical protein OPQ81_011928 [Rhizoctonia solani]|nr:hypothetical protein OPQ81_011928 [Rhizoctonia solani]